MFYAYRTHTSFLFIIITIIIIIINIYIIYIYIYILKKQNSGGTIGVSIADYLVFDLLDTYKVMQPERTADLMKALPKLAAFKAAFESRPNVAAYIATRE